MKNIRFLTFVLTIGTLLLSACGAAATPATPAPIATSENASVDAMPVAFVGIVDSIAGDQWVISGTTMTVDASIVRNGPFGVGDRIKVEGFVNPDGSLTLSRVETPTPQDVLTATPFVVDNSNDVNANVNVNDGNINDDNSNSLNSNDNNSNTANSNDGNVNDDNGGNSNSSDDNSNTANSNDDNGGNSNDDNSNTANSNDDNGGGNSNDDSGGSNSNDDNGGGGNSNDDNGNGG